MFGRESLAMREIDIRRELLREMNHRHHGDGDTLIMPELGLCQGLARVDIAVVNGSVHGYEIKSEQDTLARLPSQANFYSRTLEFVTVVSAPIHAKKIGNIVPSWWGIWTAVENGDTVRLEPLKESTPNPKIDPFSLAQLLWREEALEALSDRGLANGLRSKPRREIWIRLASSLPLEELGDTVRACLKRRGATWRVPALQV
jgi:hypothetical protein